MFMNLTRGGAALIAALLLLPLTMLPGRLAGVQAQEGDALLVRLDLTRADGSVIEAPVEIKSGERVITLIQAENAKNLAAFQFDLIFDPDVLQVAADPATGEAQVQRGDFLASSGREVACDDPDIQNGVLRYTCITLRMEPAGAEGSGTLATVVFEAQGSGSTPLTLDNVKANEPDATSILPIQVQSATLSVTGSEGTNWVLWGSIIGAAVVAVLAVAGFAATRLRAGGSAAPAAGT
jgi:hypothetical protein